MKLRKAGPSDINACVDIYIERLYVTENFRSRNYGSMLLKEVIGRARKVKSRIIFLDLAPCNRKAMRFYMRNGFQRAGRINEYHGNPKKPYAVILSYKL